MSMTEARRSNMNYNRHSALKKWNRFPQMRIVGVLILILLSGILITACDTSPGINGNGSNNGQYNNNNNKNNSCNGVNNCNNYSSPGNGSQQPAFSLPTSPPQPTTASNQVVQI